MVFNLSPGDTRPTLFSFAALALLGWGLLIYAELDKADSQHAARREIPALSAGEENLSTQLCQQEQATGLNADLQSKITAVTARLSEVTQARDQAQAQLASVQKELESWRQQQARGAQLQIQSQGLSQAWTQLQIQELSQRWAQLQQEVVKLQEGLAAQNREVADVNGRLQSARQELADAHRKLADDRQQLATCRSRSR